MTAGEWSRLPRTALTEGKWQDLFDFLDPARRDRPGPDRDREAERKCLEVLRKLVCFFAGRRCGDAEDLAAETLLRVAAKCGSVDASGLDDRTRYFYGVARNVLHEWHRGAARDAKAREALKRDPTARLSPVAEGSGSDAVHRCLDRCMKALPVRARRLILQYYQAERTEKVEQHRQLAAQFGKSVNALRIEVHRVRRDLRDCVGDCLHPEAGRAGLHS